MKKWNPLEKDSWGQKNNEVKRFGYRRERRFGGIWQLAVGPMEGGNGAVIVKGGNSKPHNF